MSDLPPLLPRSPHGGPSPVPFSGLDFSVNTNPFGPNPALLRAVLDADYAHYPDPTYLSVRRKLAEWHGVQAENVSISVGASDLLHRAARAFLPAGGTLLSLHAPFGELERAARLQRAEIRLLDELPNHLPPRIRLVYVGQPHNPTGRSLSPEELSALAAACAEAGALLLLDLAYAPFMSLLLLTHPAVINLLSPGKAHGLVGARPAYAVASAAVCAQLENLAPAWHVPAGTAALLEALPDAQDFLRQTLPQVREQAAALACALRELGAVEQHGTPYMTLEVGDAAHITRRLLAKRMKVRDCTSYGFPGRIRVSTRRAGENRQLIQALGEVLRG